MDRICLDANVMARMGLRLHRGHPPELLLVPGLTFVTCGSALAAARRVVADRGADLPAFEAAVLSRVLTTITDDALTAFPSEPVGALSGNDLNVLRAAIQLGATHLLTEDIGDFADCLGRTIDGVRVMRYVEYLKLRGIIRPRTP